MSKSRVVAFSEPNDEYLLSGIFFEGYTLLDYSLVPDDLKLQAIRTQVLGLNFSKVSVSGHYYSGDFLPYNTWSRMVRMIVPTVILSGVLSLIPLFFGFSSIALSVGIGALLGGFIGQTIPILLSKFQPVDIRSSVVETFPQAFSSSKNLLLLQNTNCALSIRRELFSLFKKNDSIKDDDPIWKKANDFLSEIVELNYVLSTIEQKKFEKTNEYSSKMKRNLETGENLLKEIKSYNPNSLISKEVNIRGAIESAKNFNFLEPDDIVPEYSNNPFYSQPDFKKE